MKRISIEEHWSNAELNALHQEWRAKTGTPNAIDPKATPLVFPRLTDIEQFRLPIMDEAGITMQVLSTGFPAIQGYTDAAPAVSMARKVNDELAEIVRKHPGRFAGFASLPTQDPKAAAAELKRAVTQLGFKGAMIQGNTNGHYLDEKENWVLWEAAEALGAPISLHITDTLGFRDTWGKNQELIGPLWSWGVDAATHALRIISSGVFDDFPKAIFILGHLGESLPYLLGRMDEGYAMAFKQRKLKRLFSEYMKENILITTSGRYLPETLAYAAAVMGIDRILFATDYPWVEPKDAVRDVEKTPINDGDKEKIFHLNAERWLRL